MDTQSLPDGNDVIFDTECPVNCRGCIIQPLKVEPDYYTHGLADPIEVKPSNGRHHEVALIHLKIFGQ